MREVNAAFTPVEPITPGIIKHKTPQITTAPDGTTTVLPPEKRKHSSGEIIFDLLVYAGIGWAVNTGLSAALADKFMNGSWKKFAQACQEKITESGIAKQLFKDPDTRKEAAATSFFISTIYTGGTLLVVPMRMLEDHKSSLVRKLDNWWHGRDVSQDPVIKAEHAQMDNAPQQSLPSLLWARALALPAGWALGPLMGNANALSTKLPAPGPLKNYNSFNNAGLNIARNLAAVQMPTTELKRTGFSMDWSKLKPLFPKLREAALEAKRLSPHRQLETEARSVKVAYIAFYDLLLSLVVATGFYLSSRVFAKVFAHHSDNPNDPKAPVIDSNYLGYISGDKSNDLLKSNPPANDLPNTKVQQITHQAMVDHTPIMHLAAGT